MFWAILIISLYRSCLLGTNAILGSFWGLLLRVKGGPFEEDLCFEICAFLFSSLQVGPWEGTPEQKNLYKQIILSLPALMAVRQKTGKVNVLFMFSCL